MQPQPRSSGSSDAQIASDFKSNPLVIEISAVSVAISTLLFHRSPLFLIFGKDFLAVVLLRFSLLFGGVFAFFSKDFLVSLSNKQGKSQKQKSKEIQKGKESGIRVQ